LTIKQLAEQLQHHRRIEARDSGIEISTYKKFIQLLKEKDKPYQKIE